MHALKIKGDNIEKKILREFAGAMDSTKLQVALAAFDTFAKNNVAARNRLKKLESKGEPFAAQNFVFSRRSLNIYEAGDKAQTPAALSPQHIRALRDTLEKFDANTRIAVQVMTTEPSPASYAKLMILQQFLHLSGLIEDNAMVVVYAAPQADKATHTSTNDLPAALDKTLRSTNPHAKGLLIKVKTLDWKSVPQPVRTAFKHYSKAFWSSETLPGFSVLQGEEGVVTGTDKRAALTFHPHAQHSSTRRAWQDWKDIYATAEVEAIRERTATTPATLYTLTPSLGPLCLSSAIEGGVTQIVTIDRNSLPKRFRINRILSTQEMVGATNSQFAAAAARGYNRKGTGLSVVHAEGPRTALHEWPKVQRELGKALPEPVEPNPHLANIRPLHNRRFTAPHTRRQPR
jgi:hypothetical protein